MTSRLNTTLYVVAIVLLCACVLGGVLVYREHEERADDKARQERYGEVLAAATTEVEAFLNIDYRTAEEDMEAVVAGATGAFKEEYIAAAEGLLTLLEQEKSVMEGEVVWAGVVSLDPDDARVIVSTKGTTTAGSATDGRTIEITRRMAMELRLVDGEWLASKLEDVE